MGIGGPIIDHANLVGGTGGADGDSFDPGGEEIVDDLFLLGGGAIATAEDDFDVAKIALGGPGSGFGVNPEIGGYVGDEAQLGFAGGSAGAVGGGIGRLTAAKEPDGE